SRQLVAFLIQLPADCVTNDQVAAGPVESSSVLVTFLDVGGPVALFEDQLPPSFAALHRVFADGILRVRELLIVIKEVLASQTRHAFRMSLHLQAPHR